MDVLGLEIRKAGCMAELYKTVDSVLDKLKVTPSQPITLLVQAQTAAHALNQMFKAGKWLDMCTIRNCMNVCQIHIPTERLVIYQSLHCVNWSDMLPEFRQTIMAMILDDFRSVLNPLIS